jgi:hypothetical protein
MAKKKEETKNLPEPSPLEAIQEQLKQHEDTLESFRTSFKNLERLYSDLKDRNRLR